MSAYQSEPHIVSAPNEYKISYPPSDGISSLQFSPEGGKFLIASSWDCSVRLYDVNANLLRCTYNHTAPVLDCCYMDVVRCASGGLDSTVKIYDFNTSTEQIVGTHTAAVRCVAYCPEVHCLLSGSWDSTVKWWDPRISTNSNALTSMMQPERVYTMTLAGTKLIVGTANRKVWVWDMRQPNRPEQQRDSSLKFQTRCIRAFLPSREGFVLSSIEGRVAVEYLSMDPEAQKQKYAFKCHRAKDEATGQELIYPVNAIGFHPQYGTFATGGSDGFVNVWDPFNKKRLCQFHKYPTSIAALSFSADGALLAIAASYQYEHEQPPAHIPEDSIFIRKLTDQETRPKT